MQQYTLVQERIWDNDNTIYFCIRGDFFECIAWIHRHTGYSWHHASTFEGYKLLDYKL
jgi:hypothetical protein